MATEDSEKFDDDKHLYRRAEVTIEVPDWVYQAIRMDGKDDLLIKIIGGIEDKSYGDPLVNQQAQAGFLLGLEVAIEIVTRKFRDSILTLTAEPIKLPGSVDIQGAIS